jgi:xanthine/CO dehydrogenase XdhC/CoxF family maturation factor
MTELETIAAALGPAGGGVAVLATLLQVDGSAYRGPGARMVVRPDGGTVGAISGGCLEKDIQAHAESVRAAAAPKLVSYDLTRDDDAPWGLNMGCNARLDVLLEPCPGVPDHLVAAVDAERRRDGAVIATCFAAPGGGPAVGARLVLLDEDQTASGPLAAGALGGAIRTDAHRVMREERSDVVTYGAGADRTGIFFEYIARPIALVICGDGADTAPLAALGDSLGWHVRCVARDEAPGRLDDRTAAVVMTHHYGRDRALLGTLLASRARYIGVLGPRRRTERLLDDLRAGGQEVAAAALRRLHAPVGLDLGAETPADVALSIAAEVRAVFSSRAGGALRDRQGPIHDRR